MNRHISLVFLSILSFYILKAQNSAETDSVNPWIIAEKNLTSPMGASSELHVAITNMPAPNLIQAKLFKPNGSEEWNQFSDGANTFIEKEIEKMLKQFSVQVRTDKIDGVNVRYIEPKEIAPEHANHLFIHLHEGGYIFGRGSAGITEAILIAARSKINVVSID